MLIVSGGEFRAGMDLHRPPAASGFFSPSVGALLLHGVLLDHIKWVYEPFSYELEKLFDELFMWTALCVKLGLDILPANNTSIFHALFSELYLRNHTVAFRESQMSLVKRHEAALCFSILLLEGLPPVHLASRGDGDWARQRKDRLDLLQFHSVTDLAQACLRSNTQPNVEMLREPQDIDQWRWDNRFYIDRVYREVASFLGGTVLFLTSKRYFGFTRYPHIVLKDRVAIFARCQMPIILRGRRGKFNVLAPALVYGMMNGEIGDAQTQLIALV